MKENYVKSGRVQQKLETRAKIIEAARYFIDRGADYSLEDVAKKANVSRATIYRYFSNTEILAAETSLAITTVPPNELAEQVAELPLQERILKIQEYFNTLTFTNESAFRKYLSVVIESSTDEFKRGARRTKALNLTLKNESFSKTQKTDLANILTIFMGLEPIIVAKDVCGLDNKASQELLVWGIKMFLKGYLAEEQE